MSKGLSLRKRGSVYQRRIDVRRFRPAVSFLEGRTLLSTFTWLNDTDGAFNSSANWINQDDQHGVPGAGDTADVEFGNITVTVPSSTSVDNIQCDGTLQITSGTFSVTNVVQSSTVGDLVLPGGATFTTGGGTTSLNAGNLTGTLVTAAGASTRFATGAVAVNSGAALSGAGLYDVTGSTMTLNANLTAPGLFEMDGGTITGPGTLTIPQSFDWTGGTLDGSTTTTVNANATLSISGGNNKYLTGSHILENDGTAIWSGVGELDGSPGSTFNNDGTFTIESDTNFGNGGDGAGMIFNNNGTLTKTGTSGTTTFAGNVLNNSGTVQLQSGTLELQSGGTDTGIFDVSSGATLFLDGGTETVSGQNAEFTGTGLYNLANGTLTVNRDLEAANFTMSSGTLNGPATLVVTSAFNWTGGDLDGAGTTDISATATMTISGGSTKYLTGSHILNNNAAATWSGVGEFDGSPGSTFNNNGTFTAESDTNFGNGGSGAGMIFNNAGTFTKSGTNGVTAFIGNVLNNSGTVNVDSGTLELQSGGTNTSVINVAAAATFWLDGGTETVTGPSAALSGTGLYELTDGTLTVNTNVSIANLTITGGTLNGPATVTIPTAFDWTGGSLDGAGTTTVPSGATLALSGAGTKYLTGSHVLNNNGTAIWSGVGEFDGSPGSTFNNSGTFTAASDANFANGGAGAGVIFNNTGTFTKSGSSGVTDFNGNTLNNSGTVNVDSGTLELDSGGALSGPFKVASGALVNLNGGGFTLSGTGVQLEGAGTVEFSGGSITTAPIGASLTLAQATSFLWNGGQLVAPIGATLNFNGALQLVGSNNEDIAGGGTFNLVGTLTETGTGSLQLAGSASGTTSTTLKIPAGSTFNFASDAGIANGGDDGGIIVNAGTIEKTAGIGTSTIGAALDNSAALVVNTGTLAIGTAGGINTGGSFSVAGGAVLDLTGGQTVSYGGTFTGSGTGQIELNSGMIVVAGGSSGATFNFPTGLFVWNGGTIDTNETVLTIPSTGTVQVTGLNGEALTGGGTLNIAGKLTQSGAGPLTIGGGTTLNIKSGGSYNLQSDAAIQNGSGGGLLAVNAGGAFIKSAGTSTATVSAALSNSGSVQSSLGTLNFTGTVDQLSGTALTGGTWAVTSTPSSEASVTFNTKPIATLGVAANVTLTGANSAFTGIASLSTNEGTFSLLGGKSFYPVGALTNLGSITLGPGTLLAVNGAFTETATAKLTVQIGGTTASPVIGAISATGAIQLAGAFSVTDASGVTPALGSTLTLINNLGPNFVIGTFAGLPGGSTITVNGMTFTIYYRKGASGRDVVLVRTA